LPEQAEGSRFLIVDPDAGFAQVEAMYLYATVLDWLQNEYRFVNRAAAGGRYQDYWVAGKDSWVTIVFRRQEKKLPRTGF